MKFVVEMVMYVVLTVIAYLMALFVLREVVQVHGELSRAVAYVVAVVVIVANDIERGRS